MYIILEAFDEDYIIPMMNEKDGTTMKFDDRKEAEEYAEKNAQKPIIVFLPEWYKGEKIDVKKRVLEKLNTLTDTLASSCAISMSEENVLLEIGKDIYKYL